MWLENIKDIPQSVNIFQQSLDLITRAIEPISTYMVTMPHCAKIKLMFLELIHQNFNHMFHLVMISAICSFGDDVSSVINHVNIPPVIPPSTASILVIKICGILFVFLSHDLR